MIEMPKFSSSINYKYFSPTSTSNIVIFSKLSTFKIYLNYEILHTMHSRMYGREGYMAIKLDMSKAYDRV